jgi:hypothetical protein
MKSKLFNLNKRDFWRGLVVTLIFSIGSSVTEYLRIKGFNIDFYQVARFGLVALGSYLMNCLATNKNGQYFKPDKPDITQ